MKGNLVLTICVAAALGITGWSASRGWRCETFCGSEFQADCESDCARVHKGLEDFLAERGFVPAHSPSAADAWVGLQSTEERRIWFIGNTKETKGLHLAIDFDPKRIRTNVRWGVRGFERDARAAKLRALQTAVAVDAWLASRQETNTVPETRREEKQRWYGIEIAKLAR